MDAEAIKEIRRRAEAATPGPWRWCRFDREDGPEDGIDCPEHPDAYEKPDGTFHSITVCRGMTGPNRENNARYLEMVDPQSITSLIAHTDRQETALRRIRQIIAEALLAEASYVPLGKIDVLVAEALGEDVG